MNQSLSYEIQQLMPMAIASGLFVSLASFTQPVLTQGSTGNPLGGFAPVAGLQNISCMDAPQSFGGLSVNEAKSLPDIMAESYRHVLLAGSFPALRDASGQGWRVTVDGRLYDLLGAEDDSQFTQTRLHLRLVTL